MITFLKDWSNQCLFPALHCFKVAWSNTVSRKRHYEKFILAVFHLGHRTSRPHSMEAIPLTVIVSGSIEGYRELCKVGRLSVFLTVHGLVVSNPSIANHQSSQSRNVQINQGCGIE